MSRMVQVFMVLRCYSCETFQVHQVKKSSNKWLCKICNEKQSVQKVYGQGSAADCRQHVQKLNMKRGEKEMAEQQLLNHPPEDYAQTFDKEHRNEQESGEHPVLLSGGGGGNKWKLFTDPQDSTSEEETEDTGSFTTDRTEFDQSRSRKKRRDLKRHGSDPVKPHPLSKSSRPSDHASSSGPHSHTVVHPYSSVSDEMGQLLSESKSPCYVYTTSDRYHKLEHQEPDYSGQLASNSLLSPSSHPAPSKPHEKSRIPHSHSREGHVTGRMTHEDKMACIRDDIGRFSRKSAAVADDSIPTVSSRWSKFMTNEREGDEEEEEEEEESIETHMLQSRMAVAKYN